MVGVTKNPWRGWEETHKGSVISKLFDLEFGCTVVGMGVSATRQKSLKQINAGF